MKDITNYYCNDTYIQTYDSRYVTINFPFTAHYSYQIGTYLY